ncbi:MAG: UDP-N-acetylmuramate dehydrogenase [Microbacteriaceae bacterium]|nr:UDP-N-acetylmuramate dehydrogenase [Microbacteriaceae bacterium]
MSPDSASPDSASPVRFSDLTTLRVGGPVGVLVEPATRVELIAAAREAWDAPEDWMILGGGSNLLVTDEGFGGTVLRIATRGIDRATGTVPRIKVQAGEPWDAVVAAAVRHGLAGIEALSGIPGTAGAGPIQNIGAYGQQLSDVLVAIDFLDFESGEVLTIPAEELDLGYRSSALKRGRLGVVLALELVLHDARGESAPVAYSQLASALGVELGARAPLAAVRDAVLTLRASKGMVLDPADPDSVSAGSFFTNPIVSEAFARGLPAEAPRFPVDPEEDAPRILPLGSEIVPETPESSGEFLVKLSAAWLIERAGIERGFALPGSRAAVSAKHTLALINRGGASAAEVAELARFVQTRVAAEFGVHLQPEPTLVGVEL